MLRILYIEYDQRVDKVADEIGSSEGEGAAFVGLDSLPRRHSRFLVTHTHTDCIDLATQREARRLDKIRESFTILLMQGFAGVVLTPVKKVTLLSTSSKSTVCPLKSKRGILN